MHPVVPQPPIRPSTGPFHAGEEALSSGNPRRNPRTKPSGSIRSLPRTSPRMSRHLAEILDTRRCGDQSTPRPLRRLPEKKLLAQMSMPGLGRNRLTQVKGEHTFDFGGAFPFDSVGMPGCGPDAAVLRRDTACHVPVRQFLKTKRERRAQASPPACHRECSSGMSLKHRPPTTECAAQPCNPFHETKGAVTGRKLSGFDRLAATPIPLQSPPGCGREFETLADP